MRLEPAHDLGQHHGDPLPGVGAAEGVEEPFARAGCLRVDPLGRVEIELLAKRTLDHIDRQGVVEPGPDAHVRHLAHQLGEPGVAELVVHVVDHAIAHAARVAVSEERLA